MKIVMSLIFILLTGGISLADSHVGTVMHADDFHSNSTGEERVGMISREPKVTAKG